ncbi:MAG: hypothetical protein GY768_14240 [Planctomycetaceae bacterium]|nr:hypothetical protein [Planctomycetaceae bacterium]
MSKPLFVIRYGMIKASIWKNQTKSGERHAVSVVRIYRNGDVWKESTRFGRDDLPLVAKVADQAHTWIFERSKSETPSLPGAEHGS